ncbi:MAG: SRPBCC domain-containing protein [Candidatus Zixiibacteriota bacterium]|nr:MAG: SRPBCC domain-containing protein [candidate division Zixibacteria bacterium]
MSELLDCKIKQRTYINASPEKVFDTLTSAEQWDRFFTTGMVLEPHPGGICSFSWKDWGPDKYTLKVPGKVIDASRPNLFAFQWGSEGNETTIRIELTAKDDGTVVTLSEEGYKNTPEGRAMIVECASGWGEAITLLKFYIEHGVVYMGSKA